MLTLSGRLKKLTSVEQDAATISTVLKVSSFLIFLMMSDQFLLQDIASSKSVKLLPG